MRNRESEWEPNREIEWEREWLRDKQRDWERKIEWLRDRDKERNRKRASERQTETSKDTERGEREKKETANRDYRRSKGCLASGFGSCCCCWSVLSSSFRRRRIWTLGCWQFCRMRTLICRPQVSLTQAPQITVLVTTTVITPSPPSPPSIAAAVDAAKMASVSGWLIFRQRLRFALFPLREDLIPIAKKPRQLIASDWWGWEEEERGLSRERKLAAGRIRGLGW